MIANDLGGGHFVTITIATTGIPMTSIPQILGQNCLWALIRCFQKTWRLVIGMHLNNDKWMERLSPSQLQSIGSHFFLEMIHFISDKLLPPI